MILSGNFSSNGNFSGYDDENERYFISKRTMENQGWIKNEDVQFPFYIKAKVKTIGQLDGSGDPLVDANGLAVTVNRLEATSVFKTKQELINSCVDKLSLEIEIQSAIQAVAKTSGLTDASVKALLEASI